MYYQELLDDFVGMCREIIGNEAAGEAVTRREDAGKEPAGKDAVGGKNPLTGIYLHGSMAMGCFNPQKSDIDLIVVVEGEISDGQKMRFMERVVRMNERAPVKGLELSVVQRRYCRPFVYPTPYGLHFSPAHLQWFRERPEEYVRNMKGEDRDLAAHFTVINRYGIALYGEAVRDVFGEVPKRDYADSIWCDVRSAKEDIEGNAVYVILNLCRAAAFLREGLCLSKEGGGRWGVTNIAVKYRGLISWALASYKSDGSARADGAGADDGPAGAAGVGADDGFAGAVLPDRELAGQFAEEMLSEISELTLRAEMDKPTADPPEDEERQNS